MHIDRLAYILMYVLTISWGICGFIAKIIGILLIAILLLFSIIYLITMCIPFRYKIRGESRGELKDIYVEGHIKWLFSIVNISFQYSDTSLKMKGNILFKKLFLTQDRGLDTEVDAVQALDIEILESEDFAEYEEKIIKTKSNKIKARKKANNVDQDKKNIFSPFIKLKEKVITKYNYLKWNYSKVCGIIRRLIVGQNKVIWFLERERTIKTMEHIMSEFKIIWKKIKPKKLKIYAKFGFQDPSITGTVLGIYSTMAPLFSEYNVECYPEFEEEILEINLYSYGKIKLHYIVRSFIKLIIKKDNRLTLETFKRLNL